MQQATTTPAFFQVAAALIPVLLLGGTITRVLPGPERYFDLTTGRPKYRADLIAAVVFLLFVFAPLLAEGIAISNILLPKPSKFDTWFVSLTLAFGTLGLGVALSWRWIKHLTQTNMGKTKVFTVVVMGVLFLFAAYSTADTLQATVRASQFVNNPNGDDSTLQTALDRLLVAQEKRVDAERLAGILSKKEYARQKLAIAQSYQDVADGQLKAVSEKLKVQIAGPGGP